MKARPGGGVGRAAWGFWEPSRTSLRHLNRLFLNHDCKNEMKSMISNVKFSCQWLGQRKYPSASKESPPYRKRWRLYILPQFLAKLTQPIGNIKSHIFFTNLFPELTPLCMQGLKFLDLFCVFL